MPTSVRLLTNAPSKPEAMKLWMASISLVTRLIRSPVCLLIMVGERQPLNVGVERSAQVVHYPLTHAGGQVLLGVGAARIDSGDRQSRKRGEAQNGVRACANGVEDQIVEPAVSGCAMHLEHVVDHDLQRPRLQNIRESLTDYRQQAEGEHAVVRSQQVLPGSKGLGHGAPRFVAQAASHCQETDRVRAS